LLFALGGAAGAVDAAGRGGSGAGIALDTGDALDADGALDVGAALDACVALDAGAAAAVSAAGALDDGSIGVTSSPAVGSGGQLSLA